MSKTKAIDWPFIISIHNDESKPLAGITVRLGSRFANTDMNGEALFLGLEPGDYPLVIDAADFRPMRKNIKINRKTKNIDFILQAFAAGSIKGNIRLLGSLLPLPDVEINLMATQPEETGAETFSFWTNWDGNYAACSIPTGEYDYVINAPHCQ